MTIIDQKIKEIEELLHVAADGGEVDAVVKCTLNQMEVRITIQATEL